MQNSTNPAPVARRTAEASTRLALKAGMAVLATLALQAPAAGYRSRPLQALIEFGGHQPRRRGCATALTEA